MRGFGMAVLFALIAAGAQAGVITGQVLDADSTKPMANVNCVLCLSSDSTQVTGTATDSGGRFRLEGRDSSRYALEVSAVGFRTERIPVILPAPGASLDLGKILLKQQALPMRGVEVTAQGPAVTYEADRRVIDVSKLPIAAAGTAVDVLEHVPSVRVDPEGNVLLRDQGFTLLIDGRPSPLEPSQALKQIPSTTIDKIEIITNPSARYSPEGTGGIINIILKKRRVRGFSALGNMNAGTGPRYNGNALLGLRSRIADVYAGGGFIRGEFHSNDEWESRTFGGSETLTLASAGSRSRYQQSGNGQAGLELRPGPRDKLSLVGRYGLTTSGSERKAWQTEIHMPGDSGRQYSTTRTGRGDGDFYFAMADHQRSFDTTGHQLVAHADFTSRNGDSRSEYDELDSAGALTDGRISEEGGPNSKLNLSLEYTLPLPRKNRFEAGIENRNQRSTQNPRVSWYNPGADSFELDHEASHSSRMTEHIIAAYATCSWDWRKLKFEPGLRGEFYQRTLDITDTAATYGAEHVDLFPSMNVSYGEPGRLQASASYSRRTTRPSAGSLRPFRTWSDRHHAGQGNPTLRPEHTNSWEATCNLPVGTGSIDAEVYYRTTSDLMWGVTSLYPSDSSVLFSTATNIGNDRTLGAGLVANANPYRWLNLNLRGNLHDYRVYGVPLGGQYSRGGISWNCFANASLQLPFGCWITLGGGYTGPSVKYQSWTGSNFNTNVAIRQTLLNRALSISLRAWTSSTMESRYEGTYFSNRTTTRYEPLNVSLALSYNFSNFRLSPKLRQGDGIEMEGFQEP